MPANEVRFALNHMCVPGLGIGAFFDIACRLGMPAVEIRNDIDGNAILDGTAPEVVAAAAQERGLRIASINALQRFNEWTEVRAGKAIRHSIEFITSAIAGAAAGPDQPQYAAGLRPR